MKDSILVGAANAAGLQSKDNSPCGSTKDAKGRKGAPLKQVSISNQDRAPKTDRNFGIGLNGIKEGK